MSKSNRRGFFGLLGAAAVAPVVVKAIAKVEPERVACSEYVSDIGGRVEVMTLVRPGNFCFSNPGPPYPVGGFAASNMCVVFDPARHAQIGSIVFYKNGNDNA